MKHLKLFEEYNNQLQILPNKSRSTGLSTPLVYLSIDRNYAIAYANGQTSSAHAYKFPIKDGVIFYVHLKENVSHYGGDIWLSGYRDEVIEELSSLKDDSDYSLSSSVREILENCGIDVDEITPKQINLALKYFKENNLSMMSPTDWSYIQESDMGYSEIGVKSVEPKDIIRVEIYRDGELIKEIIGESDYDEDEDEEPIFYHGSPLVYWEHLLKYKSSELNEDIDDLKHNHYDYFNSSFISRLAEKLGYKFKVYLDSGNCGVAYLLEDKKVLKITTDKVEFLVANRLKGKSLKRISNVYDAYKLNDQDVYIIVLEYLDSLPEELYELVEEYNGTNVNKKDIPKFDWLKKQLNEIEIELEKNGISEPTDFDWWMNMGMKNGNLAVFDIGDKTIEYSDYPEIDISKLLK